MALNQKENKIPETMSRVPDPGFDIGYALVYRWLIDKDGNVTPDLFRYGSEERRQNNPHNHAPIYCPGFFLPPALKKEIWDYLGKKLYPVMEYFINYQSLSQEYNEAIKAKDADKETLEAEYKAALADLAEKTGVNING